MLSTWGEQLDPDMVWQEYPRPQMVRENWTNLNGLWKANQGSRSADFLHAGIREVGKVKDKNGDWRLTLNGRVIFHWGPLDQGWWPDG